MSTAILISGQLRTFAKCYASQRWHVFRHFPDIHFFITVQDNPALQFVDTLRRDYGEDKVHIDARTDPTLEVTPAMAIAYDHAPYANAAPAGQLLMQHWYQNEVWKFFEAWQPSSGALIFDTIIRLRPDQFFHSFDPPPPMPPGILLSDFGDHEFADRRKVAFTPWWGRFGGVNDRFAILGCEAARAYFTLYDRIPELLSEYHCPFHPESLVKAALEVANCTIHETLRTEFTTLRANGQHRPPEIMPWDLAHAALSGSRAA